MMDIECAREKFRLKGFFDYIKFKIDFRRRKPFYLDPDGLCIFVGPQGSGKTLSAVNYVYKLMEKYPKAKLVSNIALKKYKIVTFDEWLNIYNKQVYKIYFAGEMKVEDIDYYKRLYVAANRVFPFENNDDLSKYFNDDEGVIYLIDEIHLYFNSLESKNINMDVMTQIAQQRKQRKHIVCTSQIFGRMAKPLREQFSSVIQCKAYFGFIQFNRLIDRDSIEESTDDSHLKGKVKARMIYIRTPEMFNRYDTYYTISRTKFISEEMKKGDIYDSRNVISNSSNN